jgi:hypothetical protein
VIYYNWRSCSKCGSLYADGGPSICAAGDKHDEGVSAHYVLTDNTFVQGSGLGDMWGVLGISKSGPGVRGQSDATGVVGEGLELGVHGTSSGGRGVLGESTSDADGVTGLSRSGTGVFGEGPGGGVHGKSGSGSAVYGENTADGDGVTGASESGTGAAGVSKTGRGVYGQSESNDGVAGFSTSGSGVFGESQSNGVHGRTDGPGRGVWGENTANGDGVSGVSRLGTGVSGVSTSGTGVFGRSSTGPAGHFQGHVEVTGEIRLIGADCAEQFSTPRGVAAGTVMVIDDTGDLAVSRQAYDKRVAGVIAGAGSHQPGLVLDSEGEFTQGLTRRAISLIGKTYCQVDTTGHAISVGDLLTTADVPGCAMRATDRDRAFGAVIGKALAPLAAGRRGLIPILVALQ